MQQSLDTLSAEAQLKYGAAGRAMSGMAAGSESLGDWHNNQLGAGALGLVRPPTPCSAPLHLINGSAPQPSSTPCQPDPSLPKHLLQDQASAAAAAGAGAAAASHEGRDCGGLAGAATGATCPGAVSAAGASTSLRPAVELGLQECVGRDAQGEGGEEEGEEGPGPEAVRVLLVEDDWEPPPPEADPADPAPGSRPGQAAPHLTIHPLPEPGRAAAGGGPGRPPTAPGPAATPPPLTPPTTLTSTGPKHGQHGQHGQAWAPPPLLSSLASYRLQGVVCHHGSSPQSGHYTAFTASPAGPTSSIRPATSPFSPGAPAAPSPGSHPSYVADPTPPARAAAGQGRAEGVGQEGGGCERVLQWWQCDDCQVTPLAAAAMGREAGLHGYLLFFVNCPGRDTAQS
ncbi:hypothetical protein V8C86DRAFT_2798745 [Haematococcus lacustris]